MFIKLLKNEIIKQFKHIGVLIAIGCILLCAMIIPVGLKIQSEQESSQIDYVETHHSLQLVQEELAKTPSSLSEEIRRINYLVEESYLIMAKDISLETSDWRRLLIDEYKLNQVTMQYMQLIVDGVDLQDILDYGYNYHHDDLATTETLTLEEIQMKINDYALINEEYETIILESDYQKALALYIEWNLERIEIQQQQINKLQLEDSTESNQLDIRSFESSIKNLMGDNDILQTRIDDQIAYDATNWKSNTLLEMQYINAQLNETIITESSFYHYGVSNFDTYEDYVKSVEIKKNQRSERIALLEFSLEVNQPALGIEFDARQSVYYSSEVIVILVCGLLIFIGGGTIASEYSHGTIRMLVARPVSRSKIFLAKMSMLILSGLSLILLSTLLSMFVSGLMFGFNSYSIDVASITNESVVIQNYFSYLFGEIIVSLGGLVVIVGLLMTCSTLTKSTVFTVGFIMMLYSVAAPLSAILANTNIMQYTFLPYLNVGLLRLIPDLSNSFWGQGINLNLQIGAFTMTLFGLAISTIGHYFFTKKDIMN